MRACTAALWILLLLARSAWAASGAATGGWMVA